MAQLSKYKPDIQLREEINRQLWKFLSNASNELEAKNIYSDLLTETEKIILANRIATALLLLKGMSSTQIRSTIKVSFSTVNSVAAWLRNTSPKTKNTLIKLSDSTEWKDIIEKFSLTTFHS